MKEMRIQGNPDIHLSIDVLGYLFCEENWLGSPHYHSFWELVISTFDFNNFDIDLFSPSETHKFKNEGNTIKHLIYIGFNFSNNHSTSFEILKNKLLTTFKDDSNKYLYNSLFQKINKDNQITDDANFYMQIFVFLTNCINKYMFKASIQDTNSALISEIKKYLTTNLDKKINIQQISESFYISPKYLGQIFRKETGEGILQYIKRKKMEKALLLLNSKELRITQISRMLGYDNVHFFSSTFKSYFGISPTKFIEIKE